MRADGTPWRAIYRLPDGQLPIYDYLRADGTPFLRIPRVRPTAARAAGPTILARRPRRARSCGEFAIARPVVPAVDPRARGATSARSSSSTRASSSRTSCRSRGAGCTCSTRCTTCTCSRRAAGTRRCNPSTSACCDGSTAWTRWSRSPSARATTSPSGAGARRTCSSSRTRSPCPPPPGGPAPRDPHRVAILARLEPQKRLTHAIAAFERVVAAVPGRAARHLRRRQRREPRSQAEIDERGLGESVTLRGFDPRGARGAVDVERVPDDERRSRAIRSRRSRAWPRLPGRRATTSSTARASRSPTASTASSCPPATSTRSPQRVIELLTLAGAGRADERGGTRQAERSGPASSSRDGRACCERGRAQAAAAPGSTPCTSSSSKLRPASADPSPGWPPRSGGRHRPRSTRPRALELAGVLRIEARRAAASPRTWRSSSPGCTTRAARIELPSASSTRGRGGVPPQALAPVPGAATPGCGSG